MADFEIKANDTLPLIEAQLGYEGSETIPPLDGAQVVFVMREVDSMQATVVAAAEVVTVDPPVVRYNWTRVDTAVPGSYLAEWEVTFTTGRVQTFPGDTYHSVEILRDLGNGA